MTDKKAALRNIPSVDGVLKDLSSAEWAKALPARLLSQCVRRAADDVRKRVGEGSIEKTCADDLRAVIIGRAEELCREAAGPFYRKAINATGIILHTALGRAVLAEKAMREIAEQLSGYSVLQMDLESGERSRRDARIEWLLRELTGAEAATVVNNNAAATAIVLNTVARGDEVIVSRGQLVEIGGSFRLPEVMAASGAKLVEVGTTNKTHARDYENAITENTAAILRVHPSNYKIVGFTSEVPLRQLVAIAREHNLVMIDDVGAGALIDFARLGFPDQPTLADSVAAGADLVTSSADKLIGSSQGGIIVGKAKYVEAVRKNPFARIVRVGKLTLAALEATLSLFLDEKLALREVPTLAMLTRGAGELSRQAKRIAAAIRSRVKGADVATIEGSSQMGSGSLPAENLPTRLVAISSKRLGPDAIARRLRRHEPPVITRIQNDLVLIDPRTLLAGEERVVVSAVASVLCARSSK